MELAQVRYFLATCRTLNFTQAANACGVTQPALTRAIKALEHEFGGPLFHRERARTHLTELGRLVEPYLAEIERQSTAVRADAEAYKRLEGSRLRVGVMCTIAPVFLVGVLGAFAGSNQALTLDIVDGTAADLEAELLAGRLDTTLSASATAVPDARLLFTPIAREQMVAVVADARPFAGRGSLSIPDLGGQRYIERSACEFNVRLGEMFDALGLIDETVCRVERDDWVLAMAAADMGYAFMPESCVSGAGLRKVPFDPPIRREIAVVTVRGRPHGPVLGAFLREALRSAKSCGLSGK